MYSSRLRAYLINAPISERQKTTDYICNSPIKRTNIVALVFKLELPLVAEVVSFVVGFVLGSVDGLVVGFVLVVGLGCVVGFVLGLVVDGFVVDLLVGGGFVVGLIVEGFVVGFVDRLVAVEVVATAQLSN